MIQKVAMPNRDRRIQAHARLSAALERPMVGEIRKAIHRFADVAASHVEQGNDAVEPALNSFVGFEVKIARRLLSSALAAAQLQDGELKSFSDIEAKDASPTIDTVSVLRKWAISYSLKFIFGFKTRLKAKLVKIIDDGTVAGLSNPDIAKEVRAKLKGPETLRRSMVIARTETHVATQTGSSVAAKNSGLLLVKEWGATEDERTRLTHKFADHQTTEMDEPFIVGGFFMMYPGDPVGPPKEVINCRCVALYWPKGFKR